jgi:hypothetical protein
VVPPNGNPTVAPPPPPPPPVVPPPPQPPPDRSPRKSPRGSRSPKVSPSAVVGAIADMAYGAGASVLDASGTAVDGGTSGPPALYY